MLSMIKVELENISDANICLFLEKDMTGRVSYISKRYSKDNNKYLKSCDPKQKSKHIKNLDTNNFNSGYAIVFNNSYAMSEFFSNR